MKILILDSKADTRVEFKKFNIMFSELKAYNEQLTFGLDNITMHTKETIRKELAEIVD